MASRVFQVVAIDFQTILRTRVGQVRHGHHIRGKPPTIARTLKQRLDELKKTDPAISYKVDIGLPSANQCKKEERNAWMAEIKSLRANPELEKASRKKLLSLDLDQVSTVWEKTVGPQQIRTIADHYGIYQDLFGDAYFLPIVSLNIRYDLQNDLFAKVYRGNVLKPMNTTEPPSVEYHAESDTLWTLLMTTPDGNLANSNNEYCHWFIGNIPGNQIELGEQIIDYLKPIPPRGVGYYRYIFVLYKQSGRLNYKDYKKNQPCLALKERDWNTLEFYRKHQDILTPAGLAFFQADWDPSVRKCYHFTLRMQEPVFQYDFPKPYIKPQTWFPLKEPFNLYLDKYRDPKVISKEFLLRKLKKVHPFKAPTPPFKYPNALYYSRDDPSWLRLEKTKSRLKWGRINDIE